MSAISLWFTCFIPFTHFTTTAVLIGAFRRVLSEKQTVLFFCGKNSLILIDFMSSYFTFQFLVNVVNIKLSTLGLNVLWFTFPDQWICSWLYISSLLFITGDNTLTLKILFHLNIFNQGQYYIIFLYNSGFGKRKWFQGYHNFKNFNRKVNTHCI